MIFPVSYDLLDLFFAGLKLGILGRQAEIQFLIVDYKRASTVSETYVGIYLYKTAIDDVNDSIDCDTCFGDVCCNDDFPFPFVGRLEYCLLFLCR